MGLEVTKLGIGEWIAATKDPRFTLPITLHTISGSMIPTIRMKEDAVVVLPCGVGDVRVGDIVLIRKPGTSAGVLLHRLYRIRRGKIVTLGDNMWQPDKEENADMLLGRAVSITGPGKHIDCESRSWRLAGKAIVHTYRLRPILFFARRAIHRLYSTINGNRAHG